MSLTDFRLCTALHRMSGRLTIDQSGSADDSEKDARIARRRSRSAVSLRRAHLKELTTENATVMSTLHAAELRLAELYADQSRMEEDVATRMEIAEKLRSHVRDLERENREALRRYMEQTATFEAERQALYDNEQHLKSRIQSLMAARKQVSPAPSVADSIALSEAHPTSPATPVAHPPMRNDVEVPDGPEITALKLELSIFSTSHTSLQTMVQMLRTELADLKWVNNKLQEENESHGLLLMERAMNGTGVEMPRKMGGNASSTLSGIYGDERSITDEAERSSLRSGGRSVLYRSWNYMHDRVLEPPSSSHRRRTHQSSASLSPHGIPLGKSLADLPITGPGLDLTAKLGPGKDALEEVTALRQEVKSLKDANKVLSLYASKIIDRIIMQEGFEHVLAVDYNPDNYIQISCNSPPSPRPDVKRNHTSLSLSHWKPFGMFGGSTPLDGRKNLRLLMLQPGAGSALAGAQKLESQQDEEDRRKQERLTTTMKLMGIEKPSPVLPAPLMLKAQSDPPAVSVTEETRPILNNRFSFFQSKPLTSTDLTSEAVEQAEVETTLASLDAREKEPTAA
ncbi:hypothetical protein JB92DRAFT_3089474 [Gautieria morchelliformis]|nr:hypothetical protein JB92DRAFT_3089474 [Gautieria morchelliformis]